MVKQNRTATAEQEVVIDGVITPEDFGQVPAKKKDVEDFKVVEAEIVRQIVEGMREHFTPDLCYNIPRRSKGGKRVWKECDMMPVPCQYKGKVDHIHIVGIGYHGAMEAVQVKGDMEVDVPDAPTVVEEAGRLFWRVKATCTDLRTGSRVSRWHMKPYYELRGQGVVESEFAMLVVQSVAARNVVLAMIPHALQKAWIDDYRNGVREFKKPSEEKQVGEGRRKELPEKQREPAKPKNSEKPKPKQAMSKEAGAELQAAVAQAAERLGSDPELLMEFATDQRVFNTSAQAMLLLVGSEKDASKLAELQKKMKEWWQERQALAEAEAAEAASVEVAPEDEIEMEGPDQEDLLQGTWTKL
jgi:hypothetical protein